METITTHALRLMPGSDLKNEIEKYVRERKILAGWIITCAGSLTQYQIRFANQPGGTTVSGHFEIVSLTGILSCNGSHIHISVSDESGFTRGGHVLEGCIIYTTAEIIIGETNAYIFNRVIDGSTPYAELEILNRD